MLSVQVGGEHIFRAQRGTSTGRIASSKDGHTIARLICKSSARLHRSLQARLYQREYESERQTILPFQDQQKHIDGSYEKQRVFPVQKSSPCVSPPSPRPLPRRQPPACHRGPQLFGPCTSQFYFCVSTDTSLRQMPALKPEYEVLAKAVSGRLRGDPSLPLDEEPEEDPAAAEDEEEVKKHNGDAGHLLRVLDACLLASAQPVFCR